MFDGVRSLEHLMMSIHQLSVLFDHLHEGVIITDYCGKTLFMNRPARDWTRPLKPQFVSKGNSLLEDGEDQSKKIMTVLQQYIDLTLKNRQPCRKKQVLISTCAMNPFDENHEKTICLSTELIHSIDHQVLGTILSFECLRSKNKVNEQDGVNLEWLSALGQIAAGLAHEIRNPLTAVSGYLQLAIEELEGHRLQQRFKNIVLPELDHILDILSDFINISHPPVSTVSTIHVEEILQLILNKITYACMNQNIQFQFHVEKNIPPIRANVMQMKQVILQIVTNSIEAMPYGGTLTLESRYIPENKYVLIQVNDSGPSLNQFNMCHPVISHIIESHGGYIEVDGSRSGSCVSVYLPAFSHGREIPEIT